MSETQQQIPEEIKVVTIGDCKAEIFDLLAQSRSPHSHLLIRGTHNRKVNYLEDKQRSGHPESKFLHQSIREIMGLRHFRAAKKAQTITGQRVNLNL